MIRPVLLTAALLLLLAGCTSRRETDPPRSATEQLLFSTAADRAADKLTFNLQPGTKVFIDGSFVEGTDSKYLLSSIRDRVARKGGDLMDDKGKAELVIEPRVGALSEKQREYLGDILASSRHVRVDVDGVFGPTTARAVRNYQRGVRIARNGIVGEATWRALQRGRH